MKKIVLIASTAMLVLGLTLTAAAQNDKPVAKKDTKKECCDKKDKKDCCNKVKTDDKKACCNKKDASKSTETPAAPKKK